ncbi:hypothetical protein ICM05_03750 [Leucobacter sp. cx-42]|uniref:hypothetical protein n=1 Tax=unclassified Leucobacter TaxID=2621730 RepID=UPI00165D92C4|nr:MULTISPECIES: hypothetical protein [unclassified Leucobacter]MBC9953766.1 hypothetical protein [Leucobacter sp. cx-42]
MDEMQFLPAQLHRDYEEIGRLGLRRYPEDARLRGIVDGLIEAGLGYLQDEFFILQRPEYGKVDFPAESLQLLLSYYEAWLHAEELTSGEQVLYGQAGFWQHWFNLLVENQEGQLNMDLVIPDLPEFDEHNWMNDMQPELIQSILASGRFKLRLILPPRDADGTLNTLAEYVTALGIEVRVRSSPFLFAVYNGAAAVLSTDEGDSSEESYFLTRRTSIVAPLQRVFDDHWSSGILWDSYARGAADVLSLMSLGWTDARIAEALGLSMRTVSRRVADAMLAAGVGSRFELGIKYAQSQGRITP